MTSLKSIIQIVILSILVAFCSAENSTPLPPQCKVPQKFVNFFFFRAGQGNNAHCLFIFILTDNIRVIPHVTRLITT